MSVGVYLTLRVIISLLLLVIGLMIITLGRKFFREQGKEGSKAAGIGFIIFGVLVLFLAGRGIYFSLV